MSWCHDEWEHEREGRNAYRYREWNRYNEANRDRWSNDCEAAFLHGWEAQKREEYRRKEEQRELQEREYHVRQQWEAQEQKEQEGQEVFEQPGPIEQWPTEDQADNEAP